MDKAHKPFYRALYMHTGGFVPTAPLNLSLYPGDFFQIRQGEMLLFGNIFRNDIIPAQDIAFGYENHLNPAGWVFNQGLSRPSRAKATYTFRQRGSFYFKGKEPESVKMTNWNDWQHSLLVKMTQTVYSFREIYVVTEAAVAKEWELAIAASENSTLNLEGDALHPENMLYCHRETKRIPAFFKAKKLVPDTEQRTQLINGWIDGQPGRYEWARAFFDYDFHSSTQEPLAPKAPLPDLLHANTPGARFKWDDMGLEDIERLFTDL